jgi:hypothetical protein
MKWTATELMSFFAPGIDGDYFLRHSKKEHKKKTAKCKRFKAGQIVNMLRVIGVKTETADVMAS